MTDTTSDALTVETILMLEQHLLLVQSKLWALEDNPNVDTVTDELYNLYADMFGTALNIYANYCDNHPEFNPQVNY